MWKLQIVAVFLIFGGTCESSGLFRLDRALLKQSGTVENLGAYMAVDRRMETFAVAEASNTFVEWKNLAWWMADLGHRHRILAVAIASTYDPIYSAYLDNFSVDLLVNSITEDPKILGSYQCGSWNSTFHYRPGFRFAFRCSLYYYRRYILIKRLDIPFTHQAYLAIAEVEIIVDISYNRN